ncbi:MAG: GNAT family acetyltransferase [Alphaproteobacteria bacterium]|nr:GNAT family acetyltransferase [Alphaproteobacteria bacterium]
MSAMAAAGKAKDAPIAIGPITDADIEAVVQLWLDCDLTRPWNDPRADIAQARRSGSAEILVARAADGRVLATAMVGDDGHRGWLYYVAVAPALQRSGLGRRIVAAAEDWMRSRGIAKSQLIVRATNTKVRGFYERLGYAEQPRVLMARWLDGRPMTP